VRRFGTVVATTALLFTVACSSSSGGGAAASSSAPTSSSTAPDSSSSDELVGKFDVNGGRRLSINCKGTGSPTILLEAGDEDGANSWQRVKPKLDTLTRICAYDRAGNGFSDPATGCRELDDIVGDLEALLRAVKIDGPFVLVGHSGGGFLMAGFAARHPADVAGLVLVETPKAITILPPELEAALKCDAPANIEHLAGPAR